MGRLGNCYDEGLSSTLSIAFYSVVSSHNAPRNLRFANQACTPQAIDEGRDFGAVVEQLWEK